MGLKKRTAGKSNMPAPWGTYGSVLIDGVIFRTRPVVPGSKIMTQPSLLVSTLLTGMSSFACTAAVYQFTTIPWLSRTSRMHCLWHGYI